MKLSNNVISIEVAPHGAELVSLVRKGREYMWSGDAAFWNRRAPILFPAVGKPFNNEIRIDGQVFTMKQHGFARDCEFEEAGEGLLVMKDVQPENYPYRFALEAQYKLDGNRVDITWTILNLDKRDLYAQIGAHPAFTLPDYDPKDAVHGYVRYFDACGRPVCPVVVSDLEDGNRVLRPGGRQPRPPAGAPPPAGGHAGHGRDLRARRPDHRGDAGGGHGAL